MRGHRTSQRRVLCSALVATLIVLFFVSLFTGLRIARLNRDNETLSADLAQSRARLAEIEPQNEKLRTGLVEILRNKVPHLRRLELDDALDVKAAYVKSILFTEARNGDEQHYEYTLLLENTTGYTIKPHVEVLVFDDLGVQIGEGGIADGNNLLPGDSRSRAGEINLMRDGAPAYFEVRARVPELLKSVVENGESHQ